MHQDQDIAADTAIVDTNVVVAKADRPRPPRVGLIALTFGSILRPAKAARWTTHLPLSSAFVIHALSCVLILFTILFLMGWGDSSTRPDAGLRELWTKITVEVGLAEAGFSKKWVRDYGIPAAVAAVAIELGIILLALVLASWGAIDETLRAMWVNGLRQIWLLAPCALCAVAAVGSMGVALDRGDRVLRAALQADGHDVFIHRGKDGTRYFVDDETRQRLAPIPWYYTYSTEIKVTFGFLTFGWLLWGLLSRIGARPPSAKPDRPPLCETCGYNIIGIEEDGRCPECGRDVAESLDPLRRCGPAWRNQAIIGRIRAWWSDASRSVMRPRSFGRALRRWPGDQIHRRYLLATLPLVFFAGYLGFVFFAICADGGGIWRRTDRETFFEYAPIAGSVCTVISVLLTILSAALVGLWFRIRHKENLTACAMQAACYVNGCLPLSCLAAFIWLTVLFAADDAIRAHARALGISMGIVAPSLLLGPVIAAFAVAVYLIGRVTSRMQYANR